MKLSELLNKMEGELSSIKSHFTKKRVIILGCVVGVMLLGCIFGIDVFKNKTAKITVLVESILKDAKDIGELETCQINYQSVATTTETKNKKEKLKYKTAYNGTVVAGIDEPINFSYDKQSKTVYVKVPKAKVLDTSVEIDSMDFIFAKRKHETETVSEEAYKSCLKDLNSKVRDNNLVQESAQKNAESTFRALLEPVLAPHGINIDIESVNE